MKTGIYSRNEYPRRALALAVFAALLLPLGATAHAASSRGSASNVTLAGSASPATIKAVAVKTLQPRGPDGAPQSTSSNNGKTQKPTRLKKVMVIGSLIPRAQTEGAAPIRIVTGEQIKAEGFTTLYGFLNSLTEAAGNLSRSSSWGQAAPNAQPINLRGVGPQFTLILVNGQRLADYPEPGNGAAHTTFQNAADIPVGLVARVEVMPTGASAIYGSDAMAGVINIILKKHYQGHQLTVQLGRDTQGAQKYANIVFTGGNSGDNWNIVYTFEHKNRGMLEAGDRPGYVGKNTHGYGSYTPAERLFGFYAGETGTSNTSMTVITNKGMYLTPPPGSCSAFGYTRMEHYKVPVVNGELGAPQALGQFCAKPYVDEHWSFSPGFKANDGYIRGDFSFTPELTVYGSATVFQTHGVFNYNEPGMGLYAPDMPSNFYDKTSGNIISNYVRRFTETEMGNTGNNHDTDTYTNFRAGIKGMFDNERFAWNLSLSAQKYQLTDSFSGKNELGMFHYFFGKQQGTKMINGSSYPVYQLNPKRFWYPLTPSEYAKIGVYGQNKSTSELDMISFNVNGDLATIPWDGKSIGWAAVLQGMYDAFQLHPDPRAKPSNADNFQGPFGLYSAGGGGRHHAALGTEFQVPLLSSLTWTIAGRADKYKQAGTNTTAKTWDTGIQFRPTSSLLLRGTFGTNFRAPGLGATYLKDSVNIMNVFSDPYICIINHDTQCPAVPHSFIDRISGGSPNLEPLTGKSWTAGAVWNIPGVKHLTVQATYWHMTINNEIRWISQGTALADDAGCLTGLQVDGQPYIAHPLGSEYCKEAIKNAPRDSKGNLLSLRVGPINEASHVVGGVDAALHYILDTSSMGTFGLRINYTTKLEDKSRTVAGDQYTNDLPGEVHSRMTGSITWNRGPWSAVVHGLRWGATRKPNYNGCMRLPNGIKPSLGDPNCIVYRYMYSPWITWDISVGYQVTKKLLTKLTVDNFFNAMPGIPAYHDGIAGFRESSIPAGRSWFVTVRYKFN